MDPYKTKIPAYRHGEIMQLNIIDAIPRQDLMLKKLPTVFGAPMYSIKSNTACQ